jgi:hypothetical protein
VEAAEVTAAMEEDMEVTIWAEAVELQLHGKACMTMSLSQTPTKALAASTVLAVLAEALTLNMHHQPTHPLVPRTPVNQEPTTVVADAVEAADSTPTRDRDFEPETGAIKAGGS